MPSARRKSIRNNISSKNATLDVAADPSQVAPKPAVVLGNRDTDGSADDTIGLGDLTATASPGPASGPPPAKSTSARVLGGAVRVPSFPVRDFGSASTKVSKRPSAQVVVGDSASDGEGTSDDTVEVKRDKSKATPASARRKSLRGTAAADSGGDDDVSTDELTRSSCLLGKPVADANPCDESVVVFKKPTVRSSGRSKTAGPPVLDIEGDDSAAEKTVKISRKAPEPAVTVVKPNLKKYVDDKLLKFDPNSYVGSRTAKIAVSDVAPAAKAKFVIPEMKKPAIEVNKADESVVQACEESLMDETLCADTVRLSPGRFPPGGAGDDVVEFTKKPRESSARKRAIYSGEEDIGLGELRRGDSPPQARRSSKQPRLSREEDVDKENQPSKASRLSARMGNGFNNVIAVVTSTTKRHMPVEDRISKRPATDMLAQGSFGSALLTDPNRVISLNGKQYLRLSVLGKGGSSCVYLVLSDSGALYAYKRVDVHGSDESADSVLESYENEIKLLNTLKGSSHIIELIDSCVSRDEMSIAMVLEAGDVDLARVLTKGHYGFTTKSKGSTGSSISNPFFLRTVWGEMLEAVDYIHENRIVHGDLKPANFVFVRGHLKLIDFGIAKAMSNDTTNIYRDSQVGTINYMAPEAISPMVDCGNSDGDVSVGDMDDKKKMKMRLGRPSDIWSLGCILYQMLYGKTPFSALNTIQKLHAIPNPKYEILFPTHLNTESGICSTPSLIGELCIINRYNHHLILSLVFCMQYIHSEIDEAVSKGCPFFRIDVDGVESVKMCLRRDFTRRAPIKGPAGLLHHAFLDLEAARELWGMSRHSPIATSTRITALSDIHASLTSHMSGDALKEDEAKVCSDIVSTIQRALPAPVAEMASAPRRSSRSTPLNHRGASPSVVSSSHTAAAMMSGASRKILPRGLKDQIVGSSAVGAIAGTNNENVENAGTGFRHKLRNASQSTANKWVRPRLTPEKNDMRSVLDKKFGQLRYCLAFLP